jgi:hypothetical protein
MDIKPGKACGWRDKRVAKPPVLIVRVSMFLLALKLHKIW